MRSPVRIFRMSAGACALGAALFALLPAVTSGPAAALATPAPRPAPRPAVAQVLASGQVALKGNPGQGLLPHASGVGGPVDAGIGAGLPDEAVALPQRTELPVSQIPLGHREMDCVKLKCVALTFDDGPGKGTAKLLKILAEKKAPATFFLIGSQVEAFPAQARAIADAGMEVGDHSWSHPDLTTLKPDQIAWQLDRTANEIHAATGVFPTVIRPPYGARNAEVDKASRYPEILWNVDPADWRDRDTKTVIARTTKDIKPGSIILMHETQPTTVDAVGTIIDKLRKAGLTPVTVSQLFGNGSLIEPGHPYFDRVP